MSNSRGTASKLSSNHTMDVKVIKLMHRRIRRRQREKSHNSYGTELNEESRMPWSLGQGGPGRSMLWGWRGIVGLLFLIAHVIQGCRYVPLMDLWFSKPPGSQNRVWLSGRPLQSAGRGIRTFRSHLLLSALCHVSLTQDYELEAEKLRSLLDLENGRSSHMSKRARLQSPAAKVREEVSSAGQAFSGFPRSREHGMQASETHTQ